MGTGRGFAKLGTGRGFAKLGTGRGFTKLGTNRGLTPLNQGGAPDQGGSSKKPNDPSFHNHGFTGRAGSVIIETHSLKKQGVEGPDNPKQIEGEYGDSDNQSNLGAKPIVKQDSEFDTPQAGGLVDGAQSVKKQVFSSDVTHIIKEGDTNMTNKDYFNAFCSYYKAQQVEGFTGPSNLRMAGVQIAMGRYYESANNLLCFLDGGGAFSGKEILIPADAELEKNLAFRVRNFPYDVNVITCSILYSIGQENWIKAREDLKKLQDADPRFRCLSPLDKVVKSGEEAIKNKEKENKK